MSITPSSKSDIKRSVLDDVPRDMLEELQKKTVALMPVICSEDQVPVLFLNIYPSIKS